MVVHPPNRAAPWRRLGDDWQNLEDAHGFLTDQPIDEHEPLLEPIPAAEFQAAWREAVNGRPSTS